MDKLLKKLSIYNATILQDDPLICICRYGHKFICTEPNDWCSMCRSDEFIKKVMAELSDYNTVIHLNEYGTAKIRCPKNHISICDVDDITCNKCNIEDSLVLDYERSEKCNAARSDSECNAARSDSEFEPDISDLRVFETDSSGCEFIIENIGNSSDSECNAARSDSECNEKCNEKCNASRSDSECNTECNSLKPTPVYRKDNLVYELFIL